MELESDWCIWRLGSGGGRNSSSSLSHSSSLDSNSHGSNTLEKRVEPYPYEREEEDNERSRDPSVSKTVVFSSFLVAGFRFFYNYAIVFGRDKEILFVKTF